MLRGALNRDRLASSYLFAGEDGIGKKFTAINFAKAVNCLNPVDDNGFADACESCASCKKISSGAHPDFLMVEPEAGIIKVEQIRDIDEALSFKSFEARIKTVIVDNAEAMNASAANAFLKTLEEPAAGCMIILVSSMPDRLPITIRSRCLRVNFRTLSAHNLAEVLGLEPGSPLISLLAGRPGAAAQEDPLIRRDRFNEQLRGMLVPGTRTSWKDRQDIEAWLDMAMVLLRDMAAYRLTRDEALLVNRDMAQDIGRMAEQTRVRDIIDAYGKLRQLRGRLIFNLNKGITWNYAGCVVGNIIHE